MNAENGAPMRGATLRVLQGPRDLPRSSMTTAGDGYFALANADEGDWTLSVTSPSGKLLMARISVFDNAVSNTLIEFPAGELPSIPEPVQECPLYTEDPGELGMYSDLGASAIPFEPPPPETGSVRGRVLRLGDETPLGDVAITIHGGPGSAPDLSAVTNEDGQFELDGIPEGRWVIRALSPAGESGTATVWVSPGEIVDTLIYLLTKPSRQPRARRP
jgi:hypothetical protein